MILGRDKHVHAACFDELDAAVTSIAAERKWELPAEDDTMDEEDDTT